MEGFAPEGGDVSMEVGEGAVGKEEGAGVVGEGGVGLADPVENEVAKGVGAWFEERADGADAKGTGKQLNR